MKKSYMVLKRYGAALLSCAFLSAALYAAEETAPGVTGVSEEEFTPAKEVLTVKYVQVGKLDRVDVNLLTGTFKNAEAVKVTLQKQDKAFPNGGGLLLFDNFIIRERDLQNNFLVKTRCLHQEKMIL